MGGPKSNPASKCSFCGQILNNRLTMCKEELAAKRLKLQSFSDSHDTLHRALRAKDCYTVSRLLKTRYKLCCTNGIENCVILIAKFYNNECLERVLAEQPSAVHSRGPEGETLLMYAKDITAMNLMFEYKPDVNLSDDNKENVLFHLIHQRTNKFKIFAWDCMFFEMIRCVVRHGIDVNAIDSHDKTVIEYLLSKDSDQYFQVINILLAAGAVIPPRDSAGRTPMMQLASKAYHEEYFNIIERLLTQGADPKAQDNAGNNLMYHVVASYKLHKGLFMDFQQLSHQCLKLLESGCELGGMDFHLWDTTCFGCISNSDVSFKPGCNSVNVLSLLLNFRPFCKFIRALPRFGLTLSHNENTVSELTCYLLGYMRWPIDNEMFVIFESTMKDLLDAGVNLMQQALQWKTELNDVQRRIGRNMPDCLLLTGLLLVRVALNIPRKQCMKAFQIISKVFVSLLRLWPHPPLTLLLFPLDMYELRGETAEPESFLLLTLLNFLTRVGGRLPLGTPVYHKTRSMLEDVCGFQQGHNAALHFTKVHAEIPTLKEMCRHLVRAPLQTTTTLQGLDTSSLRVYQHGEWRPVPQQIQDFLNFQSQPEFCEEDIPEFQGRYGSSEGEPSSSDEGPHFSDEDF